MTIPCAFCIVEDADQRFGSLEIRTGQVEEQVCSLKGNLRDKDTISPVAPFFVNYVSS